DLLLQDVVGLPQHVQTLLRRLSTHDPDRKAGTRKGLAPDEPLGEPELGAHASHLVLEERPQWLDQLKAHPTWQPTDVVVGLERRRSAPAARLDHVRVERSLHEIPGPFAAVVCRELLRLLLEYLDELLPDRLALGLGVGHAA